jgi:hypothetical protein
VADRSDLQDWVFKALADLGGSASIVDVAKFLWKKHESDLIVSGDMFYTWQYDMRWAATKLRQREIILPAKLTPRGVWKLAS